MNSLKRSLLLIVVLAIIVGAIVYLQGKKARHFVTSDEPIITVADIPASEFEVQTTVTPSSSTSTPPMQKTIVRSENYAAKSQEFKPAPELVSPNGYINTNDLPLSLRSFVGKKVILVDFWTYSCINCQRTIPYLKSWYEKYKGQGFEIVGVHTPEFDFEKNIDNVKAAVKKFGITYPVVLDSEYKTWDAYKNQYWPEKYLIDINGLVVDRHIGEGGYEETEKKIQELLNERKAALNEAGVVSGSVTKIEQSNQAGSPETYFGWGRNEYLANGKSLQSGTQTFTLPKTFEKNLLYLDTTWNFEREFAENTEKGAKIVYRYSAKDVYFVARSEKGVSITILRDGVPVKSEKGDDVAADGTIMIKESRLYHVVNESSAGTHTLQIIVNGLGLQAFTFTFG